MTVKRYTKTNTVGTQDSYMVNNETLNESKFSKNPSQVIPIDKDSSINRGNIRA